MNCHISYDMTGNTLRCPVEVLKDWIGQVLMNDSGPKAKKTTNACFFGATRRCSLKELILESADLETEVLHKLHCYKVQHKVILADTTCELKLLEFCMSQKVARCFAIKNFKNLQSRRRTKSKKFQSVTNHCAYAIHSIPIYVKTSSLSQPPLPLNTSAAHLTPYTSPFTLQPFSSLLFPLTTHHPFPSLHPAETHLFISQHRRSSFLCTFTSSFPTYQAIHH